MPRIRLLADIEPLRQSPPFRRLWIGSTVSAIGGALTAFAIPLQIWDITHSAFAVGALGIAAAVPTLTVGLLGGSLADRMDRRRLVLITSSCLAAVSAGLAAQAFAGLGHVWLLYLLAAVESAFAAVDGPVRRTFVPSLLTADQLTSGMALTRLSFQIMLTVGPAVAGLIAAVPALGLRSCYLIDAISFGAALYGVGRLPAMPSQSGGSTRTPRAVAEGLAFIRRSKELAGAFLADLSFTIFALPASLFPAINAERFGGNPRTLGLFVTAIGVGGLLSAALSGPLQHVARHGRAMLCTVAVSGAAIVGFALARSLWLTLATLAVVGAADTVTVVFRSVIVQACTPDRLRGRVTATDYVVGAGGGQLGNLEAGALGSLTTPVISALVGGLATIASAIAVGLALPAFVRYRHQTAGPQHADLAESPTAAAPVDGTT